MDTEELEALDPSNYSHVNMNGGVLGPLFPVVHSTISSFVLLTLRERLLSWHYTARSLIFSLQAVLSSSMIRPTIVVPSANLMMVL